MERLNLPAYEFRLRKTETGKEIFDCIRKKFVTLTPEEWVRQNFILYLINEIKVPESLIAIEFGLKLNNMQKRADIAVYDKSGKPLILVECKAPQININQDVFDQVARYNIILNVPYLIVTNGLIHYCCYIDYLNNKINFTDTIPLYSDIC